MGQSCGTSSLETASHEIDARVDALEVKIESLGQQIRDCVAKSASDTSAKQRALQLIRRKKVFEEQRRQLLGAQFNVESLADQQLQANVTLKAVDAMKASRLRLKKQQEQMSVNDVDKLVDDSMDAADELRTISEALAQGSGLAELESEYAQLQSDFADPLFTTEVTQESLREPGAALPAPSRKLDSGDGRSVAPPGFAERMLDSGDVRSVAQRGFAEEQQKSVDDLRSEAAKMWASSTLKAAMAPYAHLPGMPGMPPPMHPAVQPAMFNRRIQLAA